MNPKDVWAEFVRDRDIAKAGRKIFLLARDLRSDIVEYLSFGQREVKRVYSPRKLKKNFVIEAKRWRVPRRYPVRSELMVALKWVKNRLGEVARAINISVIAKWDLIKEIERIKERILSFRGKGRKVISLHELIISREELVPALISLLFMEKDGEVELLQDKPFEDIYVVLKK